MSSADLNADVVLGVPRVHADRAHDLARRLGATPDAAVRAVEQAATELIHAAARTPKAVPDPVGWFYSRARALSRGAGGEDDPLPLGSGVLSTDDAQLRLAEALESRPARDRAALLLRDSYHLPLAVVSTVLGLDEVSAAQEIGAARLALLPALTGVPAPVPAGHAVLADLTRLADGGAEGLHQQSARRHVLSCPRCAAVVDAQTAARRLLAGLTVVALPDADRERLLAVAADRAHRLLPPAMSSDDEDAWADEPQRRYSLSLMAFGLVVAVGAGLAVGAFASKDSALSPIGQRKTLPLVTAAPALTAAPGPTTTGFIAPSPRVFLITPSPTPSPSPSPTPSMTDNPVPLSLELSPSSGPPNTQITVSGQGWTPSTEVVIQFMNQVGEGAAATTRVTSEPDGSFVAALTARDDNSLPGPHQVTAEDGEHYAEATFTITS